MGSALCQSKFSTVQSPKKKGLIHSSTPLIGESRTFLRLKTDKFLNVSMTYNYLISPTKKRDMPLSDSIYEALFSFNNYEDCDVSEVFEKSSTIRKVLLVKKDKSSRFIVKRTLFSDLETFSKELIALRYVAQHEIEGVENILEIKMMEEKDEEQTFYLLDIVKDCREKLNLREGNIERKMQFFYDLLWILSQLHEENIYWGKLRPYGYCFLKGEDGFTIYYNHVFFILF
jgi:hypothetical protein